MPRTPVLLLSALISTAALCAASCATPDAARPIHATLNLSRDGLAIDGYDPVAYFPEGGGRPIAGSARHTASFRGATYLFVSEEHRARFLADPERYEPAYGGWCAYAMAFDDRVEIDPASFLIEDGSLLLFYDGFLADTRKRWLKEGPETLRPQADRAWSKLATAERRRDEGR